MTSLKRLRLLLGDQLHQGHSWFSHVDDSLLYVLMEIRSETDYVPHHIQKILGFFGAMRRFAQWLESRGHTVLYLKLDDPKNRQTFTDNLLEIFRHYPSIQGWEYQEPDEYRLDIILKNFASEAGIPGRACDSEHFYTSRNSLREMFGQKVPRMEFFYRNLRKKHHILMEGDEPLTGRWNYDAENRKKVPKGLPLPEPMLFSHDLSEIRSMLEKGGIRTVGKVRAEAFSWPLDRQEALQVLEYFVRELLPLFGTYEDAMTQRSWSLFHSRLSFALNLKMLHPDEVIQAAIAAIEQRPEEISYNQVEGFVRQILGWREFVRGLYWREMPVFAEKNFLEHRRPLPQWFWTGKTNMNCLKHAIGQTMEHAYAHHIQRLMVIGNFSLLAGLHPDELDQWYLSVYIDAIEWVEMPNTRGMSQFADGGLIASKPYVSSAAYIDKMSDYCGSCAYSSKTKTGEKACPFNSLYWHFYHRHSDKLRRNPRIGMMYQVWEKMENKTDILEQAEQYLSRIETL
jgi:deoxyribodipyrimidine photolyase-related protein